MAFKYGKTGYAIIETDTETGRVRGTPGMNPHFSVFKGIPYAKPPVGELRWKHPQPAESWEGVRDCTQFGNIPYQFMGSGESRFTMSEDCLYINVWTPAQSRDEKLPVLFWNYGGAFMGGYSNQPNYDGEAMCKRGVVFVSFNYRTGPLGMLSHPDMKKENPYGSIGNIYYLDQIAALKWTRRNIANFGGDPDRITIMGHSSGAVAVTALAVTPLTKNDIVGCIIQSGPVTRDFMDPDNNYHSSPFWISESEAIRRGIEYMELCGCTSLEEMRSLSCEQLKEAYMKTERKLCHFRGVVDGYVFPDDPVEMYFRGENHDVNYIIGQAGDEGMRPGSILTRENIHAYAQNFGSDAAKFEELCSTLSDGELSDALLDNNAMRCRMFAETQLKNNMKPVYAYSIIRRAPGDDAGAYHGEEHWYILQALDHDWRDYSAGDYDLSRQMAQYWANFVINGNPNGPGLIEWTPVTNENKNVMMFDTTPWMGERKLSKVNLFKIQHLLNKK